MALITRGRAERTVRDAVYSLNRNALADWLEDYADYVTGGAGEDDEVVAFAADAAAIIRGDG